MHRDKSQKSYVYVVKAGTGLKVPIKVGMTDNVHKRIKQLQTGNPQELFLAMHFECNDRKHAFRLEKTIHQILDGQRLFGEWFKVSKNNVMKLFNSLGDKHKIDSLVKNMDLFDRAHGDRERQLKKTVDSRDVEIKDMKAALSVGRFRRRAYVNELLNRGVTWHEIRDLRRKARSEANKLELRSI